MLVLLKWVVLLCICMPTKSKSTKLCPVVGSGILHIRIIPKTILCLILDIQGICICTVSIMSTNDWFVV